MTATPPKPSPNDGPAENTDRELWRERDDYYADSIHVTEGGGIGINVGGHVTVLPLRTWHTLAKRYFAQEQLVIEIARELYDRFVMGGLEPQDAYPQIREWMNRAGLADETAPKENK